MKKGRYQNNESENAFMKTKEYVWNPAVVAWW